MQGYHAMGYEYFRRPPSIMFRLEFRYPSDKHSRIRYHTEQDVDEAVAMVVAKEGQVTDLRRYECTAPSRGAEASND